MNTTAKVLRRAAEIVGRTYASLGYVPHCCTSIELAIDELNHPAPRVPLALFAELYSPNPLVRKTTRYWWERGGEWEARRLALLFAAEIAADRERT